MRRLFTWLAGGLGAAALVRELLRRQRPAPEPQADPADPAGELRAKLEQARGTVDDRDEFDASEGVALDEVGALREERGPTEGEPPVSEASTSEPADEGPAEDGRSLEERRRAVHDKAQEALGQMRDADDD